MIRNRIYFLSMLFAFGAQISVFGQPGGGGPFNGAEPVPIAGSELLLLAGAAYGLKKVYWSSKKKS